MDLKPINILLGGNGAGKSNFVSVFSLIRNIYNKNLQNYIQKKGGADNFLYFGSKNTSNIDLGLTFEDEDHNCNKFRVNLESGVDSLFIKEIWTAYLAYSNWHSQKHEENVLESNFCNIHRGQAFWVNSRLREFNVYHFHDTSDTSPMKKRFDLHDNHFLRNDGSNLASFLYYLQEKEPKAFKRIEMTVGSIAPFFDRFVLRPSRLNEDMIRLEWVEKGFSDLPFSAYHLSDGTLRFICLATLLMQPNPPKTIVIDEPELGLHPVAINKIVSLIKKVSDKSQVILSTQSTQFVDQFEPDDIIVTDRSDKGSLFRRLTEEELAGWLDDYTLGDLWGKNKFGAQPYKI